MRQSLTALGPNSRQIILSDGRALGFDEFGDPAGTPVLFFHGFGSSRIVRHPDDGIAAELGARMIAVDRPGIGLSERRSNRRMTDWPQDVQELLDALGIERCSILAWSGGGPYALACAWVMPQRFDVLGLISCPAPIAGVRGAPGYIWPRHRFMSRAADHAPWVVALAMWNWSRAQRSDPEKQLDDAIAGMVDADRAILGDPELRAVMIANAEEMYRQGSGGIYDEALCLARPWGFPLEGVSVPVRLWHGVQDQAVPVGMGRYIERTVPGTIATYFPDEAHHFVYDRWREILSVIVAESLGGAARRSPVAAATDGAVAASWEVIAPGPSESEGLGPTPGRAPGPQAASPTSTRRLDPTG